jgi:hypothetical protein
MLCCINQMIVLNLWIWQGFLKKTSQTWVWVLPKFEQNFRLKFKFWLGFILRSLWTLSAVFYRFSLMNRKLLEPLYKDAAKIAPDFWPDYDMRYTNLTRDTVLHKSWCQSVASSKLLKNCDSTVQCFYTSCVNSGWIILILQYFPIENFSS